VDVIILPLLEKVKDLETLIEKVVQDVLFSTCSSLHA